MKHISKYLLLTVAAILLVFTAGIKETMAWTGGEPNVANRKTVFQNISYARHILLGITAQVAVNQQSDRASSSISIANFRQSFARAPLKVKILILILVYLLLSLIILFLSILINRQIKTSQRNRALELKNEFQNKLAVFLFDDVVERIEFRGMNRSSNRQIFIDELVELHSNLHGEAASKLRDLYFKLNLHKDSLRKVEKGAWFLKSKGFAELAQMDVKDASQKIQKYANSKNPILRMQAQVALVKLSEDNPLGFLDNLDYQLSYWEQVNIYDTLVYHQIFIESFEPWLTSQNSSVVIFALRMIGLFKHTQSGHKVRELLFSDNPEIALTSVQAMKSLELAEYSVDLKVLYRSETLKLMDILQSQRKKKTDRDIESLDDVLPRKIRYEIIQSLQPLATPADIPFLEQVMKDDENTFRLRILAIKVMLGIRPEGETYINELVASGDELLRKMINNVKQNQES